MCCLLNFAYLLTILFRQLCYEKQKPSAVPLNHFPVSSFFVPFQKLLPAGLIFTNYYYEIMFAVMDGTEQLSWLPLQVCCLILITEQSKDSRYWLNTEESSSQPLCCGFSFPTNSIISCLLCSSGSGIKGLICSHL